MLIRCPQCQAGYNIPEEKIGENGRTLRCVKCKNEWHQPGIKKEEEAPQAPLAPVNPQTDDVPKMKTTPKKEETSAVDDAREKLKRRILISSFSALVAVLILFSILVLLKDSISSSMPAMKGFYSAIGLGETVLDQKIEEATSMTGLVILEDEIERILDEDATPVTYTFVGKVKNTNTVDVVIPTIRVSLRNDKGIELDFWPAQLEKTSLAPGEEARWVCRFFNPPIDKIYEHKVYFVQK